MDDDKEAFNISLRLLARSAKSKCELERRLKEKGVQESVVARVLQRLVTLGFVDDDKFARSLAERYKTVRPSGKTRILFELKRKGIPSDICKEVVSGYSIEEQLEVASELARRKWASLASAEVSKRKKKTFDFLLRRGFDYETADQALRRVCSGEEYNV